MADYDDYRIADEEEAAAMNAEFSARRSEKDREEVVSGLPVYLTDEARKAARLCGDAAKGCEYLLDYATDDDERKLLGYAASAMRGLCAYLGGDGSPSGERFGSSGVKRSLARTLVLCDRAAITICDLCDSSGRDAGLEGAARTAVCAAQSVMAVYLLQI